MFCAPVFANEKHEDKIKDLVLSTTELITQMSEFKLIQFDLHGEWATVELVQNKWSDFD